MRREPDEELRARLAEELAALREMVQRDIDTRFEGLASGGGGWGRRLLRHRGDIFALLFLLALGALFWQVRTLAKAGTEVTETTSEADTAPKIDPAAGDDLRPSSRQPPAGGAAAEQEETPPADSGAGGREPFDFSQPAASWQRYLEGNRARIAPRLAALARGEGLGEGSSVSPRQQPVFEGFAAKPETIDPAVVRIGVFEYAVRRLSEKTETGQVNLNVSAQEYPPAAILEAARALGVADRVGPSPAANAPEVQIAIAWAWLERENGAGER